MSWEIFIQDLPEVSRIADVPADFRPAPLGTRDTLIATIRDAVPGAEPQDKDWLFVRTPGIDLSIQFHMEDAKQVRYIVVHVHGGDMSAHCVAGIMRALDRRAIDTSTGELFDADGQEEGL